MRKEDRIRQQGQNPPQKPTEKPQPAPREQVKGGATDKPDRPPRQPGPLPIPD